ncbi:hypothetical protein BFL28_19925 [Sphingomonas turrisvirgatae]|uniref:Uncharacterized protein n=1 Tax=Sphingomonas turrisvirgatae TaxID=1888892 RepID=A0A1E3LR67_9SPHN|nr:hypothetical protein BFL28_19925 [Sphingomonas turrisvirgatae]
MLLSAQLHQPLLLLGLMYCLLDLLLLLLPYHHHLNQGLAQSKYHPVLLQHLPYYHLDKSQSLLNQVLLYL